MAALGKTPDLSQRLERAPNTLNRMPLNGEDRSMSCKPILRDPSQETQPDTSEATSAICCLTIEPRPADAEMARVLKTEPLRMASDPSSGAIAHWKHGAAA